MSYRARHIFLLLLCSVLLTWVALYNGYPLVTSDSGAYVRFAFDFQVLRDRSPFYPVFLAASGLRLFHTLWLPVFVQSFILSALLLRFYAVAGRRKPHYKELLVFIAATVLFTTAPLTVSFVMPDVFTPILFLSCILYLYDTTTRKTRYVYLLLVAGSVLIHNSHFILSPLFLFVLLITSIVRHNKAMLSKALHMMGVTITCLLMMCYLNYSKGLGWTVSPASHIFFTAKFAETGILKQYLDDSCGSKQLRLCAYKDALPQTLSEYLWENYSPLYKTGGWTGSKTENEIIIRDVFTTPHYLGIYLQSAVINSCRQLGAINPPEKITPMKENSSPWKYIRLHINKELDNFQKSIQYSGKLIFGPYRYAALLFFIVTSLWVIFILPTANNKKWLAGIYSLTILFILCNAFVTATFTEVTDRFNYRVFWLLPAINTIYIVGYYIGRYAHAEYRKKT